MKRILPKILAVLLLFLLVLPHAQAAEVDAGGNLENPAPTKAQIASKWYEVTEAETYFSKAPVLSAPYNAGRLADSFLQNGITYLNYVRYVANLPQVQMDTELNKSAQHGAVLLAAVDKLASKPAKPDDMAKNFYDQGLDATIHSNISSGYGTLQGAISGYMSDSGNKNELSGVGHRRWLLNPKLLNVGFGCAISASKKTYITTRVFDKSGSGCDYDFISWPASGNHPTNLFSTKSPWSVTLNPNRYRTPHLEDLKITIVREADKRTWTFNASTGAPVSAEKPYLTVNTKGYGVSNCIIFHPGSANVDPYQGVYTVSISGLYTKAGDAAKLRYQVDFFDVEDLSVYSGGIIKKVNGIWKYYYGDAHLPVTTMIKHSGSWYYVNKGVVDFDFVGFVKFNGGQYFVKDGKVPSKTTGLVKCDGVWYYVVNGKLASDTTTLVKHNGEWFYVTEGQVASTMTTLVNYNGGWYYIYKGKMAAKTTTLVKYCGVWYYVENGKVNFGYTGPFRFNGGNYQIKNGKIA